MHVCESGPFCCNNVIVFYLYVPLTSSLRVKIAFIVSNKSEFPSLRIQPLSDALGDLYGEFNALKVRLSELTVKFEEVEGFVDDVRSGRKPSQPRGEARPQGWQPGEGRAAGFNAGVQGRRRRVVVRRIKKPAA